MKTALTVVVLSLMMCVVMLYTDRVRIVEKYNIRNCGSQCTCVPMITCRSGKKGCYCDPCIEKRVEEASPTITIPIPMDRLKPIPKKSSRDLGISLDL